MKAINRMLTTFLIKKREIIRKKTDGKLLYITATDLVEIMKWPAKDCIKVVSSLDISSPGTLCPWCIKHKNQCSKCNYGKRNGICDSNNSRYAKLIKLSRSGAILCAGIKFDCITKQIKLELERYLCENKHTDQYPCGTDHLWLAKYRSSPLKSDTNGGSLKLSFNSKTIVVQKLIRLRVHLGRKQTL